MIAPDTFRRYAGLALPRYTSYPTAAEFTPAVGEAQQQRWLRQIDGDEAVSLYLHVPYCRQLCHYCGCHAKLVRRDDVLRRYEAALLEEIDLVARLAPYPLRIAHLHWGGGTPTSLGADGIARIVERLDSRFVFAADAEHAIELDPRAVTPELALRLATLGVGRVSLGVQDLDPDVQRAIGRVQPLETVAAAFASLRAAGLTRISVDLIYGLPQQSVATLTRTVAEAVALGPDRIACYGYAHMPARRANQKRIDAAALPGPEQRSRMAAAVAAGFTAAGYSAIGIDHFAKPDDPLARAALAGRLHRNFQGYTDDDRSVLIGLGASAISRLPGGFVQNIADVPQYTARIAEGRLAGTRGCPVDAEDARRARIVEALMCNFRADLDLLAPGADFADERALLRPLVLDGLCRLDGDSLIVTEAGRPLVRAVAAIFDRYRTGSPGAFSLAV